MLMIEMKNAMVMNDGGSSDSGDGGHDDFGGTPDGSGITRMMTVMMVLLVVVWS